jgi:hypothetical protein
LRLTDAAPIFEQMRDLYLAQFLTQIETANKQFQRVLLEAVYCSESGEALRDGSLNLPMRVDLIAITHQSDFKTFRIDSLQGVQFEVFHLQSSNGPCVTIAPFLWDCLKIQVRTKLKDQILQVMTKWFIENFDECDSREVDSVGMRKVVHFLSDPKIDDGVIEFEVDLGSAEPNALETLLERLANTSAHAVQLGQI